VVPDRTSGFATTALVLCLLGFLTCGLTSVVAIPFGHLALVDVKRNGWRGQGMAMTALIAGYTFVVGTTIWLLVGVTGVVLSS
jgi:hypothetical protein